MRECKLISLIEIVSQNFVKLSFDRNFLTLVTFKGIFMWLVQFAYLIIGG